MTRPPVVLDASGPMAWLLRQAERPLMIAAMRSWAATDTRVLVPDHFWLEVSNPLMRRHGWTSDAVMAGLRDIDAISPQTITVDRPVLLLALDLAERHRLTTYDASYAALAQVTGGTLATFDQALREAVPDLLEPGFGEIPVRRVNDGDAAYGEHPVAWPDWSGIGSYLGVLRRRARDELAAPDRR